MSSVTLQEVYDSQVSSLLNEMNVSLNEFCGVDIDAGWGANCKSSSKCIKWRGFGSVGLRGKCCPYTCEETHKQMLDCCHMLATDPVIQGATSKLVKYVVGARGHAYDITARAPVPKPGRTPTEETVKKEINEIKNAISIVCDPSHPNAIRMGKQRGWAGVQRESFKRRITCEYFRVIDEQDGFVNVFFLEPQHIKHPSSWKQVEGASPIEQAIVEIAGEGKPDGEYGVHYDPSDMANVLGYFEHTEENIGTDSEPKHFWYRTSDNIQHGKMMGDSNDARSFGIWYQSYPYIEMARSIMDSLNDIAKIQAKFAVIWEINSNAKPGKMIEFAETMAADTEGGSNEIEPGIHIIKGANLNMPSTKIRTNQWTAIIQQLLRFAGASADVPDFMMSSVAPGGRSNGIAVEGPFDVACQSYQEQCAEHDIPLLWRAIAVQLNWSQEQLIDAQDDYQITLSAKTTASRDYHRILANACTAIQCGMGSREEWHSRLGLNYELTVQNDEIDEPFRLGVGQTEQTEAVADPPQGNDSLASEIQSLREQLADFIQNQEDSNE